MRLYEGLLALVIALGLGLIMFLIVRPKASRRLGWGLLVPLVVAGLQWLIEGPRWQMYPAYAIALVLGLIGLVRLGCRKPISLPRFIKVGGAVLGVLVLGLAVALPLLLPVFAFPAPTGPYKIGTVTYHWKDTSRPDLYSANISDQRELMVQVWYPTQASSALRAAYVDDAKATSTGLTRDLHRPSFLFNHLEYVTTHAMPAAPIAADKPTFPVLIYLSGQNGFRQASTFQIENLVSHGYIVAGIDQPHSAAAVKFPDGRVVYPQPEAEAMTLINQSLTPSGPPPMLNGTPLPEGIIPYLAKDATFTLDKLSGLNAAGEQGPLSTHMDFSRIGLFGISLGAMATAEACHEDRRIQACLMMDAAMPANVVASGLDQPSMWITRPAEAMRLEDQRAGGWPEKDRDRALSTMRSTYSKIKPGDGYYVSIAGMFHHNFFDIPYWSPLMPRLGLAGPIDPQRGFDIVNAYTLSFFDNKLGGLNTPLLEGSPTDYSEVTFEKN